MSTSVVELFDQAVTLGEADRATLAGLLLESLDPNPDPGVEAAWVREVQRRLKDLDEGRVQTIPWTEVKAALLSAEHDESRR